MNRSSTAMRVVRLALVLTLLTGTVVFGATAIADSPRPMSGPVSRAQEATPTPTVSPSPTSGDQPEQVPAGGKDLRWLAVALLIFGLLGIAGVFTYLSVAEGRYYSVVKSSLLRLGKVPNVTIAGGIAGVDVVPKGPLSITGPATVQVGQTAEYKASKEGTPVKAKWSVTDQPADAVKLSPPTEETDTVQLVALKPVAFTLVAETDTDRGTATVSAVTVEQAGGSIAFIGSGWGTVVIALVAVVIIAILALLSAIDRSAVATLLGTLFGYIFVKGASEIAQRGTGGAGTGGNGGGTSGGTGG